MKRVIIESPFRGLTEEEQNRNISYARSCMKDSLDRGEAPFCGHLLYTQPDVLDNDIPEEHSKGIDAHLIWGAVAEAVVVYQDYGISLGMRRGIVAAQRKGQPIEYRRILHPELSQN